MEKMIKVHIFCIKPEICRLIQKMFNTSRYAISCTPSYQVTDDYLKRFHHNMDCIILDIDIEKETKDKIKEYFQGTPVICLPSLDNEGTRENDVKYISEPLKLSELRRTLDEIFLTKQN